MDKKLSYTADEIDARLGLIPTLQKSIANAEINGRIFATISAASASIVNPKEGAWLLIGSGPYTIYRYNGTAWASTGVTYQQGAATTTSQVTDTTQGKTQQTINAEVQSSITNLKNKMDGITEPENTSDDNDFVRFKTNDGSFVGKISPNGAEFIEFLLRKNNTTIRLSDYVFKKLKIVIVGNSYSRDSWSYVPFILLNYGISAKIGIIYKSGNYTEAEANEYSSTSTGYYYNEIDTDSNLSWGAAQSGKTIQQYIKSENWDIVVLQQSSTKSVTLSNYIPSANTLMKKIMADMTKPFLFGWNINHTRQTADDKQSVLDNCKKMFSSYGINIVFPYGTAIFNARTNSTLAQLGDKTNFWQDTNGHLQEGLPCYTAALANVQALFNRFYPSLSIIGNTMRPTDTWVTDKDIPEAHGNCVGVTDENCRLVQRYAVSAVNDPFNINSLDI